MSYILGGDAKIDKKLQRIPCLLDIQDADRRHTLARTLNELQSLARQIDPGIKFYGRIKTNGYQSIYIAVISSSVFAIETQIRTLRMQGLCERGSASHSQYKKNTSVGEQTLPCHSGDQDDG